jgi:hypothetical protein
VIVSGIFEILDHCYRLGDAIFCPDSTAKVGGALAHRLVGDDGVDG